MPFFLNMAGDSPESLYKQLPPQPNNNRHSNDRQVHDESADTPYHPYPERFPYPNVSQAYLIKQPVLQFIFPIDRATGSIAYVRVHIT